MDEKNNYKKLAKLAKDFTILYVEDNPGLKLQASKILKKFFSSVLVASDGQEGFEIFKEKSPDIVITDIKMPKMSGLDMARKMKNLDQDAKIIVASAFSEKAYLLESIEIGVVKYLNKPIPIEILIETLIDTIEKINSQNDIKLFERYTVDSFEYQNNMLILIQKNEVLVANKKCLNFFSIESNQDFREFFRGFSKVLLPQDGFLYKKDETDWLDTIKENENKLFSVKIKDKDGENRHFALKSSKIPDKSDYYILSFDDITELGLLKEHVQDLSPSEQIDQEKIKMVNILHVLKRNRSKIRLYNSYKGLSISNTGTIEEITAQQMSIKTTYLQQRAIHIDKKTILEAELLPKALECKLVNINFDTQMVTLNDYSFIQHLPSEQKYVRVMPEDESIIEVFFNTTKITFDIKIIDISIEGCNLSFSSLPAGMKTGNELLLKLKLGNKKSQLEISTKSEILKIEERSKEFRVVTTFNLQTDIKKEMIDYIAKRQMALIREFKGLKNAK